MSMEFSRQKSWSVLSFPTLGDLLDPGLVHGRRILYLLNHLGSLNSFNAYIQLWRSHNSISLIVQIREIKHIEAMQQAHICTTREWQYQDRTSDFYISVIYSQFSSAAHSCLTLCLTHGLRHARLSCPSSTPRACSNSCP